MSYSSRFGLEFRVKDVALSDRSEVLLIILRASEFLERSIGREMVAILARLFVITLPFWLVVICFCVGTVSEEFEFCRTRLKLAHKIISQWPAAIYLWNVWCLMTFLLSEMITHLWLLSTFRKKMERKKNGIFYLPAISH